MNTGKPATVLIVGGLRDPAPEHWQQHLSRRLAARGVAVRMVLAPNENTLSCAVRVDAIAAAAAAIDGPILLVAHSAAVMMVVHWAQRHSANIQGALLVAPTDVENPLPPGAPTTDELKANGWLPIPRVRLPFASIVAASGNDPMVTSERAGEMATCWGSRFVPLGDVGHVNVASGFGDWPLAEQLLSELGVMPNIKPAPRTETS